MVPLREGARIGPYVVETVLPEGKGGFSQVVVAVRRVKDTLGERVAIKIAKTETSARDAERAAQMADAYARALGNEVETLRQLKHPGIVRLYPIRLDRRRVSYVARAMEIDGKPWYFVMEYLVGGSVDLLLEERGGLSVALAAEITQQVCAALDYVHSKGFAHLDIKTSNILLRQPFDGKASPEAVLVDFGAAQKVVRRAEVEAGALVYLPPERVLVMLGRSAPEAVVDKAAADIYSLGVALYRMLTGRLPFSGHRSNVTTAILTKSPTRPSTYNDEIRRFPELDDLILQMLEKQPAMRPLASEVVARLERIIPSPRFHSISGLLEPPRPRPRPAGVWRRLALVFLSTTIFEFGALFYVWPRGGPEVSKVTSSPVDISQKTFTPTLEPTVTATLVSLQATATPTVRPLATSTFTPMPTSSTTPTQTQKRKQPTATPVPTHTPTPTPKPTPTPTHTPTATQEG